MHCVLVPDTGERTGYGHAMRCVALATELSRSGHEVTLVSRQDVDFLTESRLRQVRIPDTVSRDDSEAQYVGQILRDLRSDVCITDGYHVSETYMRLLREHSAALLVALDNRHDDWLTPDLVIRQRLSSEVPHGRGVGVPTLSGSPYLLVRGEFASVPRRRIRRHVRNILVTLGGCVAEGLELIVKGILSLDPERYGPFRITIASPSAAALRLTRTETAHVLDGPRPVRDMAAAMLNADLAVSAGGTTLYELAATGLPAICVTVAENQERQIHDFASAGTILALGPIQSLSEEQIGAAVEHLARDLGLRQRMSEIGQRLVDGQGARRCVEAIVRLFHSRKGDQIG